MHIYIYIYASPRDLGIQPPTLENQSCRPDISCTGAYLLREFGTCACTRAAAVTMMCLSRGEPLV